jgi:hypothetical protein
VANGIDADRSYQCRQQTCGQCCPECIFHEYSSELILQLILLTSVVRGFVWHQASRVRDRPLVLHWNTQECTLFMLRSAEPPNNASLIMSAWHRSVLRVRSAFSGTAPLDHHKSPLPAPARVRLSSSPASP